MAAAAAQPGRECGRSRDVRRGRRGFRQLAVHRQPVRRRTGRHRRHASSWTGKAAVGNGELAKVTNRLMEKKTSAKTGSLSGDITRRHVLRGDVRAQGAREPSRGGRALAAQLCRSRRPAGRCVSAAWCCHCDGAPRKRRLTRVAPAPVCGVTLIAAASAPAAHAAARTQALASSSSPGMMGTVPAVPDCGLFGTECDGNSYLTVRPAPACPWPAAAHACRAAARRAFPCACGRV